MDLKSNDITTNANMTDEVLDKADSNKIDLKNNQQFISELICTADPLFSIEKERKNLIASFKIPNICFVSFYPNKNENYLIPISLHFIQKPTPSVLSFFTMPREPYTIYFECLEPADLLHNLKLIPQLAEIRELSVQSITTTEFVQLFCNFNTLCYIKVGNFVKISDPEFDGDFGQIISVNTNNKKCLLKIIPRIDYDNLSKQQLISQIQLSNKMQSDYRPPKSLFDTDQLNQIDSKIEYKTKTIEIENKIELELTVWDQKLFYGHFQYKYFDFEQIKTIHEEISDDQLSLFNENIYLNEHKIEGLVNFYQKQDEQENQNENKEENIEDENPKIKSYDEDDEDTKTKNFADNEAKIKSYADDDEDTKSKSFAKDDTKSKSYADDDDVKSKSFAKDDTKGKSYADDDDVKSKSFDDDVKGENHVDNDDNEEEEINPVIQDDENNESVIEEAKNEGEESNSSILSDIPKRFPQVSILTNYITLKIPQESFVWLEKTDGLHTNIIIESNKAYSIVNGNPELIENLNELNLPEFEKRTILDTEFYEGKYYVFDAGMIEGEDISDKFFKERMSLAQQLIEKTKVPYFIMKEYYEITSWKELIQFVDKNIVSPFTGNHIDGVVCQRIDKPYYCTVNDPGCFKLKRKVMITIDFYVRYQENEKRFYLYLHGNYKNYIFNLKQLPKNNKYMKLHTGVDTSTRELPKSFDILFASPYEENLHLFKPRTYWSRNGYFPENITEIETLMNDIIKNPMNYDKKIIEMSLADDGWVPMRIRKDKMHSNGYFFGVTNSSIIFSPVTGEESYFSKKFFFDTTITDPYHKINQIMRKYIIEHTINMLDNPRLNVLDLAGGRGADLLSLFHSGAYNIFAVDADRNALVQYVSRSNNLAKVKWEKLRSSSVDLAKNRKTFSLNAVYAMLGKNNTKYITDIKSRYEYPEDGFDVILMNYAIHYLCYSHECIRQLNRFIKTLLRPRGLFIFSCFDGDLILKDMRRNLKTNDIELNLNSFNIKLLNDISNVDFGPQSDRDAEWAMMALPTIDASGYRPEPLVQRRWLRDLNLRVLEHYYPLRRCEKYIKDIENKDKVIDYLDYIQVYVMEK